MNFEEKRHFALQELKNAGIWESNYNPPIVKLIHKLGLQMPFPHYISFIKNTLGMGAIFGIFWGLTMYFFVWGTQNVALMVVVLSSVLGGAVFGIAMASYYRYTFKKYKLTPWDEMKNTD